MTDTRSQILGGLVEAALDALIAVGPDGRIAVVNGRAERLFGYRREELIGEPVETLLPAFGDDVPQCGRRRDQSGFPVETGQSIVDTDHGPVTAVAVHELRTDAEHVRAARQLAQAQRLESLGQLAGGVAHDFNNLLGVIQNYAMFAQREVRSAAAEAGGERWESVQADLAQIIRAGGRAADLTRQLLAFGRREVTQPRVLDLNAVLDGTQPVLRRTMGDTVRLNTMPGPDLWPVFADPAQLEHVLVTLAQNARDAMPGGGTVVIDTANVTVDRDYAAGHPELPVGRYVRLRVGDTGPGIPTAVADRIFEPFFTTKPAGSGVGLSLATVHGIVGQAGGHISVVSEPGHGATFMVLLPATECPAPDPASARPPGVSRCGEKVLVVEDEDPVRELTRRILARNGYRVLTAATGSDAIHLARRDGPGIDLLLTDVVMPHMLGKEVAAEFARIAPGVPVLYMSGYAYPVLTEQGTLAAGVTLVEKPFTEHQLLAKVRQVLDA